MAFVYLPKGDHIRLGDYSEEYPRTYQPLIPETGANRLFVNAFVKVPRSVTYDRSWSDGRGCHTVAINEPFVKSLKPGEIVKSITPGGRRMLLIGTVLGSVLIFERFMAKDKRGQIYICNTTKEVLEYYDQHFEQGGLDRDLTAHAMLTLLGENPLTENIGHTFNFLFDTSRL